MTRGWCSPWAGFVLAIFCMPALRAGELPGVWKTFTSQREVRAVSLHDGVVWAATDGGLFSYRLADSVVKQFTTSAGLKTNSLSAVAVDKFGTVWTGASSGIVQAYSPSTRQWKYVSDIARDNAAERQINSLVAVGDTLYIASQIGINAYLIRRDEFWFTARSFGSGSPIAGNVTAVARVGDSIWIGTRSGVAVASAAHPNLSSPSAWRTTQSGLPSNTVTALAVFRNTLYAATTQGVTRYDGTSWSTVAGTAGRSFLGLASNTTTLSCVTSTELTTIDSTGAVSTTGGFVDLGSLTVEGSRIVLGSQSGGLALQRNSVWRYAVPNGPATSRMIGLAVDQSGVVWAGTGSGSGQGFMSFDGKTWRLYNRSAYPILGIDEYYKVNIGANNTKWVSSWGHGVVELDATGNIRKLYNASSGLPTTACCGYSPDFVVVAAVVSDNAGLPWVITRPGTNDTVATVILPDSSLNYILLDPGFQPSRGVFTDGIIDGYGTLWLANSKISEGNEDGIFFYNGRGFPGSSSTHWGRLTAADGLTSGKIFCVAVDQTGQVWCGTDKGINLIVNPYGLRPQLASYVPLREQQIYSIVVDPLNNKWVGTTEGVFLLSPDGTSILAQYTVENTDGKLADNEVQSIAFDRTSGTVYFGTERGLSSLGTSAPAPLPSFDELVIRPNPFYVPSPAGVTIDGLVQNSSLKIMSVDGQVIKDIKSPGGRIAFWDGTDARGNYVSTGVYVIVAFSENGSQVAVGKVAVLRK